MTGSSEPALSSSSPTSCVAITSTSSNSSNSKMDSSSNGMDNLKSCTPHDLSQWLLQHRFDGNEMDVTNFLLETVSSLPNAQAISDQLTGGGGSEEEEENVAAAVAEEEPATAEAVNDDDDLGPEILVSAGSDSDKDDKKASQLRSFLVPRVRAAVTWHAKGLRVFDKNNEFLFQLTTGSVERLVVFPKPEDCQPRKTVAPDMVLLVLKQGVAYTKSKKPLTQVCWQLPADLPVWNKKTKNAASDDESDDDDDSCSDMDHADQWTRVFCTALGLDVSRQTTRVVNPAVSGANACWRYTFSSFDDASTSTTTGGMPFVKCYKGVQDGVLYPLQEGLLFFKPPLFVPRSDLHSIACGRGGDAGGGSSRYVDLTIEQRVHNNTDQDDEDETTTTLEFTNIHRSELTVLREYIHQTLIPAMKKDAAAGGGDAGTDDAEIDAQVMEVDEEEPDESSNSRGCRKRKAGLEARAITKRMQVAAEDEDDDDEDDEDFMGDGGGAASNNDDSDEDDDVEEEEEEMQEEEEEDGDEEEQEADAETESEDGE